MGVRLWASRSAPSAASTCSEGNPISGDGQRSMLGPIDDELRRLTGVKADSLRLVTWFSVCAGLSP